MHDRPHERARRQVDFRIAARHRLRGLRGRHRLAGQDRLVALQPRRLEQPQISGNEITDPQRDDVAGHEVADVDPALLPVAGHQRVVADIGVQRGNSELRPVLVDEAETRHSARRSPSMITASVGSPVTPDTTAAAHEQDQERVAQLPHEHAEGRDPMRQEHVRAEGRTAPVGVGGAEPGVADTEGLVDLLDRSA